MMVNLFGMTAKAVSVPGKDLKFETKYSAVGGLKWVIRLLTYVLYSVLDEPQHALGKGS